MFEMGCEEVYPQQIQSPYLERLESFVVLNASAKCCNTTN